MEVNSKVKHIIMSSDARYPREGFPICPSILSDILNRRIPTNITGEIVMKINELDESAWITFSKKTCEKLGKLVIKETQKALSSNRRNILNRRISTLPKGLSINDLPLDVRTFNCFARMQGVQLVKKNFVNCTIGDLMMIRNFGAKSLVDFLSSLEYATKLYGDSKKDEFHDEKEDIDSDLFDEFLSKVHKLKNFKFSDQILSNDIRFGKKIRSVNQEVSSLRELAEFLEKKEFVNSEDVKYSINIVDEIYSKVKGLTKLSLEKELLDIVNSIASERDTTIYLLRYGWDGGGKKTLEDVGGLFDLTRERARQICKKIDRKFNSYNTPSFTPTLNKAVSLLSKFSPCIVSDLQSKIESSNLLESPFEMPGLLHASSVLAKEYFELEKIGNSEEETVVPKKLAGLTKSLVSYTKKASRHWGALSIEELIAQFEDEKGIQVKKDFVISVLQSRQDFKWLDKPNEWFWLKTSVSTRVTNRIKKILSVAESISASDLRTCIRRDYQMEGYSPPKYVLIELCRQLPEYTVENEIITLDQPLKWEDVLDENEMLMVLVLKEEGPVLRREELEEYCLDLGMNRNTLNRYLSHSPIIFRYGYMVYGLPNAEVDSATIQSLIPERKVSEVLEDYGWKDGKVWLGYNTSKAMIRDGLFTVPATMKKFIEGTFELKSSDDKHLGNLTIKESGAWGLVPLFRRRGGEPGDFLILEFDLSKKEAIAKLGDESLIENLY